MELSWIPLHVLRGAMRSSRLPVLYEEIRLGYTAIDLVTVFDAILTSRQTREKIQCLYENLMSNNYRKTAVLKKISIVN